MIRNTFSILRGIGEKFEKKLWKKGILDWGDFLKTPEIGFINQERKQSFDRSLVEAGERLAQGDSCFFARALKQRDHWRLYENFKGNAVCLDIESNGYPAWGGGYVTVVGLYDGFDYKALVRGENLNAEALERELSRYRYLITFFGTGFDMPFLKDALGVKFRGAHFDLCFGAKKLGLSGGLKRLEERMGLERDASVKGLDGYDAVKLWREARRGNLAARELLITYNRYDTVNLYGLASTLYEMLKVRTGIKEYLN